MELEKLQKVRSLIHETIKLIKTAAGKKPLKLSRGNGGPFSDEVIHHIQETSKKLRNIFIQTNKKIQQLITAKNKKVEIKKFVKADEEQIEEGYIIDPDEQEELASQISEQINTLQSRIEKILKDAMILGFLLGTKKVKVIADQLSSAEAKKLVIGKDTLSDEDIKAIQDELKTQKEYLEGYMKDLRDSYDQVLLETTDEDNAFDNIADLTDEVASVADTNIYRVDAYAIAAVSIAMMVGTETSALKEQWGTGGLWHTMSDGVVCDDCESLDGKWMTWKEFWTYYQETACNGRCRCGELFEVCADPNGIKDTSYFLEGETV